MQQRTNDEEAVRWVRIALQDFMDEGRDRQEAVNEVLISCTRVFGPQKAHAAESELGIKFRITRPN
jgi:hypothetical protein